MVFLIAVWEKENNKHRKVTLLTNRSSKKTEGKPVVCHGPNSTSCRELTWLGEVPTFLSQFLLPSPTAYLALAAPADAQPVRTLVGLLGYRIEMAQTKFKPTLKTCERGAGITQQGFTLLQQKSIQSEQAGCFQPLHSCTHWLVLISTTFSTLQ